MLKFVRLLRIIVGLVQYGRVFFYNIIRATFHNHLWYVNAVEMSQAIYIYVKVASHLFEATPETIVDSTNSHKSYFQVFFFKFIVWKPS